MLRALQIENFRGLRKVDLPELRRVNLIVGANDTGKTSVLEALTLLLGDERMVKELPGLFRRSHAEGHGRTELNHFWHWLSFDQNSKNQILIRGRHSQSELEDLVEGADPSEWDHESDSHPLFRREDIYGESLVGYEAADGVKLTSSPGMRFGSNRVASFGPSNASPVEAAERYNSVVLKRGSEERFEALMRAVDPRVQRLRYARMPGSPQPLIYVDLGLSEAVPITQMGQAFGRLFNLYTEILVSNAKVLLIDEIENGIFSDLMPKIWAGLMELCAREGVQIFATTHSRECVMAAQAASQARGQDDLALFRLQRVRGEIEAIRLGGEHLELAAEMGLEVRS